MEKMDSVLKKVLEWRQHVDGFNRYVGLRVTAIGDGTSEVEAEVTPDMLNPLGTAHGGMIYTLCDAAAGTAAASHGRIAVTLNSSIQYLRPANGGSKLYGHATEIKAGRHTAVYTILVTDDTEREIAYATFTMFYTDKTIEDMKCLAN